MNIINIQPLANRPEAIPTIAHWYHCEWGHLKDTSSPDKLNKTLSEYLNRDKLPTIWVAIDKENLIGAIQLRHQENRDYPQDSHWLGGVFVDPLYRKQGVATQLIQHAIEQAKRLEINELYLQTESKNVGLYHSQGWQTIAKIPYHALTLSVMHRRL